MKKRKFPNDVARFFNPQKSGTNADFEYEQLIKYYKALNKKLRKEKGI